MIRKGLLTGPLMLLAMPSVLCAQDTQPEGYWQGAAVHAGSNMPMSLRFLNDPPGVEVDVPSQGIFGRFARSRLEAGKLLISVGRYRLALEPDPETESLRGGMQRSDAANWSAEIEFLRVPDPGTPAVTREDFLVESEDGTELAGSLILPDSPGPHPGILFVQGRSYGSRYGHYYDAVAAARRGIAGLVFDGRGVGDSGGQRGRHTLQQRLDDALAALTYLREHDSIDRERVGLFGHSAGGWVIPVVAQHAEEPVSFLILHAGPVGTVAQQQGEVIVELSRRSGELSEELLGQAHDYQKRLIELAVEGAEWEQIAEHVSSAEGQPWAGEVDRPNEPGASDLGYFRRNPHDNRTALATFGGPILAVYGGDDYVVPPAPNVARLEELLGLAGNEDFETIVFPAAGHDLRVPEDEGPPYRWAGTPPGYYDRMLDWVRVRVGL